VLDRAWPRVVGPPASKSATCRSQWLLQAAEHFRSRLDQSTGFLGFPPGGALCEDHGWPRCRARQQFCAWSAEPRKRSHGWQGRALCRACWFTFSHHEGPAIQQSAPAMRDSTMSSNNRQLELVRPVSQRSTNRWPLRVCLPACALVFATIGIASPTFARSSFDGDWSVVIETRGGACPSTLRYPVAISNGIVTNAGDTPAAVSGRVTPAGTVRVTVQSSGSWASGSGRLGTTSGTGVWRGQGSAGSCEGTWQAQRRSSGAQVMGRGAPIYNYAPEGVRRYYPGYPSR
jgi:hypothetical protein